MKGVKQGFAPMAEINVTPFVDIMLVLLIIFMVTAPMMQQGVEVDLPKAKGSGFSEDAPLVIAIRKEGHIYLGNEGKAKLSELGARLAPLRGQEVLLKADREVPYGVVIEVMAEVKKAGIEKIGMVTDPDES